VINAPRKPTGTPNGRSERRRINIKKKCCFHNYYYYYLPQFDPNSYLCIRRRGDFGRPGTFPSPSCGRSLRSKLREFAQKIRTPFAFSGWGGDRKTYILQRRKTVNAKRTRVSFRRRDSETRRCRIIRAAGPVGEKTSSVRTIFVSIEIRSVSN